MQIFRTSPCDKMCALHLDDKRLNKIILESMQIISTALWLNDCPKAESLCAQGIIYLPSHEKHPLCRWASEHSWNLFSVFSYGINLYNEYKYRFEKGHKAGEKLHDLFWSQSLSSYLPRKKGSPSLQPNCTKHFKHLPLYYAYTAELNYKWRRDKKSPTWTKRNQPAIYFN